MTWGGPSGYTACTPQELLPTAEFRRSLSNSSFPYCLSGSPKEERERLSPISKCFKPMLSLGPEVNCPSSFQDCSASLGLFPLQVLCHPVLRVEAMVRENGSLVASFLCSLKWNSHLAWAFLWIWKTSVSLSPLWGLALSHPPPHFLLGLWGLVWPFCSQDFGVCLGSLAQASSQRAGSVPGSLASCLQPHSLPSLRQAPRYSCLSEPCDPVSFRLSSPST